MTRVLKIDASMRHEGSVTRELVEQIVGRIEGATVVARDLADAPPAIDANWIAANFTDPAERSDAQRAALAFSDTLVEELRAAELIVIGLPVYNFGVPAAFKAWIDQVVRARETFRYTETGPVGLLTGKRAIVAIASGGTEMGSQADFVSGYVRHILGFIGIADVRIVAAEKVAMGPDGIAAAKAEIDSLAA